MPSFIPAQETASAFDMLSGAVGSPVAAVALLVVVGVVATALLASKMAG